MVHPKHVTLSLPANPPQAGLAHPRPVAHGQLLQIYDFKVRRDLHLDLPLDIRRGNLAAAVRRAKRRC